MLVSECRTQAKEYLGETGDFWTNATILSRMNQANRDVYRLIASEVPLLLGQFTHITFPASTEAVTLSGASYLNATFLKILAVSELLTGTGAVSDSNPATPIELCAPDDLERRYTGRVPRGVRQAVDARVYGAVLQQSLRLAPVQTRARYLRILWIQAPSALTQDSDNLLGGLAAQFHDYVMLRTAWYMAVAEKRSEPSLSNVMDNLRAELLATESTQVGYAKMGYEDPYA